MSNRKQLVRNRFLSITYNEKDPIWGRSGGGWLWKLGVMGGSSEVLFDLTFFTIRINFKGRGNV